MPVIVLYPVTRAWLDVPKRIRSHHAFDLLSIYDSASAANANYRLFHEWFRDREAEENDKRLHVDSSYRDAGLQATRKALGKFLPEFSDLHFSWSAPQGLVVGKEGFGQLYMDQLSDGEQCLLAMIGDLARRLAIANPNRTNPLAGEGVVFIDEVDLHLHPTWQYRVIDRLSATFPNCQFVISTHSPCILSNLVRDQVFFLQSNEGHVQVRQGIDSYGKDAQTMYEDYMQLDTTRPVEIADALREIYRLVENDLDAAQEKLHALQKRVVDDAELEKIQLLIDRKRLLSS